MQSVPFLLVFPLLTIASKSQQGIAAMQLMLDDERVRVADKAATFVRDAVRADAIMLVEYAFERYPLWFEPCLSVTCLESMLRPLYTDISRHDPLTAQLLKLFGHRLDDAARRRLLLVAMQKGYVYFLRTMLEQSNFDLDETSAAPVPATRSPLIDALLRCNTDFSEPIIDTLLAAPQFNPFPNNDCALLIAFCHSGNYTGVDRLLSDARCDLTQPLEVTARLMQLTLHFTEDYEAPSLAQFVLHTLFPYDHRANLDARLRLAAQILDRCTSLPRKSLSIPLQRISDERVLFLFKKYDLY